MTLKSELDQFGQLFKHHLNGSMKATLRWVTATAVNWQDKTMTGTDCDDLPYYNILLGVGMMSVKPVINTDCLIAIVEGDEATAFLMMADQTELIEFNGGGHGGLTITPELKKQLGKLTSRVDGIIAAINNGTPAAGAADGGAGLQMSMKGLLAQITDKEDFKDIEDKKITH